MPSLLELIQNKQRALAAGKRQKTLKPVAGRGRYRVLPSWRGGNQQFWHDFGQHFIRDTAGELKAVYVCVDKTYGKECEICQVVAKGIKSAADDATLNALKDAKAAGRVLVNALHVDGPNPTQVQILELPATVFASVLGAAQEWEEAGESIFDPASGRDIIIGREGSGMGTKYTVTCAAKPTAVPAGTLERLNDLDAYVQQENSDAEARALTNVRNVAGLLAAPARPTPRPAALDTTLVEDDDPYATAAPPKRAAAPVVEQVIEDVPDLDAAKPASRAAAPAPAAPDEDDDELASLIAKL